MNRRGAVSRILAAITAVPGIARHGLQAWATLEPADWSALASRLARPAADFPATLWLQWVNARVLRAARRSEAAIAASRKALALRPSSAALLLEHGRALRQGGERTAAISSFAAAAALGSKAARAELRSYAARAALPVPDPNVFARSDYAAYAKVHTAGAPPPVEPRVHFSVRGEATGGDPVLTGLDQQTYPHWSIADDQSQATNTLLKRFTIDLPAGARLDPQCLAWLNHAVSLTGAEIVRADHDYYRPDGTRCDPVFLPPQPDLLWTEGPSSIARLEARAVQGGQRIYHVPGVLMSLPEAAVAPASPDQADPAPVSVIIPSRNNPRLLATAIATLRETAARPDLLELILVDNGSTLDEALALNEVLRGQPGVKVLNFNEPFNWSRANNIGAAAASADVLLFLNDDTAMQTPHWDRILAALLQRPEIGLVGARMTYPDGSLQHAGFVFGMDNGPQHEGRWLPGSDCGPAGRWIAIRQAAGVTGAFMAMRSADFAKLGQFDEAAFAVDFADLDLCLRVRAAAQAVVYCGAISLIHHESVSRGLNLGRRKRRRMRAEWLRFRARWGKLAIEDPWYHPIWARTGASYDGLMNA